MFKHFMTQMKSHWKTLLHNCKKELFAVLFYFIQYKAPACQSPFRNDVCDVIFKQTYTKSMKKRVYTKRIIDNIK